MVPPLRKSPAYLTIQDAETSGILRRSASSDVEAGSALHLHTREHLQCRPLDRAARYETTTGPGGDSSHQ